MDLGQIVAIATLLWVLGTSGGPKIGYDGVNPPPPPPQQTSSVQK